MHGKSAYENIIWSIILYPITIKENGIPNGTKWLVTLTGTAFKGIYINITPFSTTNTITFNELNGTYFYTLYLLSGFKGYTSKFSTNFSGTSVL